MKIKEIILLFTVIIMAGCGGEKTDQIMLELDQVKLKENLNYDKIVFYKYAKLAIRSAAIQDTTLPEYQKFSRQAESTLRTLKSIDPNSKDQLSILEALKLYKEYRSVKGFVKETDEDVFPTLVDGIIAMRTGKIAAKSFYPDRNKINNQNIEHAALSVAVLTTRDLGQPIALYECSKTEPEKLEDGEVKTLLEFIRGFLFFSNNLYYLSEDGLTRNIKWLDKNQQIPLPYTKAFFGWSNLGDEQTHLAFHGMNYLFRGFDRMRMDRKIDEERSLQDFELFLKDMNTLGLQNELTLVVDSYLNLKRDNPEKAISALEKLKKSNLLSDNEREAIQKTIDYQKNRDPEGALKNVYDKAFMAGIATKYMIAVLAKIDWEKVMINNNVPHAKEIVSGIEKVKQLSNAVSSYTSKAKGSTKTLKKTGGRFLDQAKGFLK
ncbi:short-chain dehydrogenase [Pedobacter petrophilus]|uniref:Short-chain dehydrogenase n=1 Tax=Pedobacter petrophilus TaxID=1908241 RepID=A0A7K0FU99_9SPHI|nr:short-chain dehydrogenase [Pedobacter petrophilus]MRX74971.1 short-chain dehydrogenase [Pedobacter petrophilus]